MNKNMEKTKRKFAWVDELAKKTGEVAMEEARKHNTYIVYTRDDGKTVRAYPDGRVEVIKENEKRGESAETDT
ncbi:hypothetical protein NST17_13585 [Caldifermentibacillus hisashii]|uniref:DUF2188 domain-containing protein n=1 Tax=Caldifermentibacillus hisashii TaxID=996558 RepID=A0ABU9K0S8_9BACI